MTVPGGLLAGWEWLANARNGGGTYATDFYPYNWRAVIHEIQGSANPSVIRGHASPPHLWYDPITRARYQTVPLDRSAFALWQGADAPHYTNKARALQVEIAGFSTYTPDETPEMLANIARDVVVPLYRWVEANGGKLDLLDVPDTDHEAMAGSATETAPQRFTPQRWADFRGVCGHRHVPMGDDHWDPGAMRMREVCRLALAELGLTGPYDPTTTPVNPYPTHPDQGDDVAKALQFRTPDGTIWMVDGIYKTPLNNDGLRTAMMDLGILAPPGPTFDVHPWTLDELVRVDPTPGGIG